MNLEWTFYGFSFLIDTAEEAQTLWQFHELLQYRELGWLRAEVGFAWAPRSRT